MIGLQNSLSSIDTTALARQRAHEAFDQLWKRRYMTRTGAYQWLAEVTRLSAEQAHISKMNIQQCNDIVKQVLNYLAQDKSLHV